MRAARAAGARGVRVARERAVADAIEDVRVAASVIDGEKPQLIEVRFIDLGDRRIILVAADDLEAALRQMRVQQRKPERNLI